MDAIKCLCALDLLDFTRSLRKTPEKLKIKNKLVCFVQRPACVEQPAAKKDCWLRNSIHIRPIRRDALKRLHLAAVEGCAMRAMISQKRLVLLVDIERIRIYHVELGIFGEHARN